MQKKSSLPKLNLLPGKFELAKNLRESIRDYIWHLSAEEFAALPDEVVNAVSVLQKHLKDAQ